MSTEGTTPESVPLERRVRPLAHRLASQLQNAAYNCGYEDAHPSNATTRQDKADAKARETLAALYAEIDRMHADAVRLDWMSTHEAWIGWNREGDMCRVWVRSDDEDDHTPEPVCGWPKFFDSAREAIDAAMAVRGGVAA